MPPSWRRPASKLLSGAHRSAEGLSLARGIGRGPHGLWRPPDQRHRHGAIKEVDDDANSQRHNRGANADHAAAEVEAEECEGDEDHDEVLGHAEGAVGVAREAAQEDGDYAVGGALPDIRGDVEREPERENNQPDREVGEHPGDGIRENVDGIEDAGEAGDEYPDQGEVEDGAQPEDFVIEGENEGDEGNIDRRDHPGEGQARHVADALEQGRERIHAGVTFEGHGDADGGEDHADEAYQRATQQAARA